MLPEVQVLDRTDTTKYLGNLFGNSSIANALVNLLEQSFYDGFKIWYRRARTLLGRLLVAYTMVLSRFWHYTYHVPIPIPVKALAIDANRFVLSKKHDRDASHIQLIPKEFLYQRRAEGGLKILNLAASLESQRL